MKNTEEILKLALEVASEEATDVAVRRTVSKEYREKIGPTFKMRMEEACNKTVEDIKKAHSESVKQYLHSGNI